MEKIWPHERDLSQQFDFKESPANSLNVHLEDKNKIAEKIFSIFYDSAYDNLTNSEYLFFEIVP